MLSDSPAVPPAFIHDQKIVLILVGLIGSGKSTFAQALEQHLPQFRRCNQDELGDRHRVEALARQRLSEGLNVCIDRTNVDETQRSHWINIAHEFPQTVVWVLVFETPYEVCTERLRQRTYHPTIKTPKQAMEVLRRFSSGLRPPSPREGYDRISSLQPSDHPSQVWSQGDVIAVLQRLKDSPPVPSSRQTYSLSQFQGSRRPANRGNAYRGYTTGFAPRGHRAHPQRASSSTFDPSLSAPRFRDGPDHSGHPRASHLRASWNPRAVQHLSPRGQSSSRARDGPWRSALVRPQEEAQVLDLTQTPGSEVNRHETSPHCGISNNETDANATSGGSLMNSGSAKGSGSVADPFVLE